MDENPITRAIDKKLADIRNFFWDAAVALSVNGISGDYVDFGSWGANTLQFAYEEFGMLGGGRHLWAFDSFAGMPEPADSRDRHPGWRSGGSGQGGVDAFHQVCAEHGIPRDAYTAVEGYYEDTLPPLGEDGAPTDIALVYIDCNMYSSTVSALGFLAPRLKHGMIIAFDDYYCWSSTQISGERSAFLEFQAANPQWHFLRYKEVNWGGVSFVVEHASQVVGAEPGE